MGKINLQNQRIALKSVDFKRYEASSVPTRLFVKDSVNDVLVNGNAISFTFKREAYFEPTSLFSISVEFIYIADISDDSIKAIEEEGKKLDASYIKEISKMIINNTTIPSHASLVIANNTSLNGASPLVTQPSFIE